MSRISDPDTGRGARDRRGMTLVEILVGTSLAAILAVAVLSAYLFLGRNLTRLVNFQEQEVESRRFLRYFTTEVSAAISLTTATATTLTFTMPTGSGNTTVSYVYTSGNSTVTRTAGGTSLPMATGLTAFTFTYYNEGNTAVSGSPQSVKSVEFAYTSASGSQASGTQASYRTVSPRVLLRNKQVLQ
jgi:prepilin-type N-terminal cleavage/methylation domain-containing protein